MDPLAPLTLLALASGYLFTTRFHLTSYQAERHSGYHLLFQSACWGIGLLIVSQVVLVLMARSWPASPSAVRWLNVGLEGAGPFALTFAISILTPPLLNQLFSKEWAARRVIQREGSELEKLLYDSQSRAFPVSVSLKNEKVYIGWPVYTPDPVRRLQDIRILPAASGFRDPSSRSTSTRTSSARVRQRLHEAVLPVLSVVLDILRR